MEYWCAKMRNGEPVNGEPSYSLGLDESPNHHELALHLALGDNFYLVKSLETAIGLSRIV